MKDLERLLQELLVERYRLVPKVGCVDTGPINGAEQQQNPLAKGGDGRRQERTGTSRRERSAR